jgi:transposase-like protein
MVCMVWRGPSARHSPALEQFLGTSHGLSAATVGRLTEQWKDDAAAFNKRSLKDVDYVYLWVDGIHLKVRLEQDKVCLLVMIGVRSGRAARPLGGGMRTSDGRWHRPRRLSATWQPG